MKSSSACFYLLASTLGACVGGKVDIGDNSSTLGLTSLVGGNQAIMGARDAGSGLSVRVDPVGADSSSCAPNGPPLGLNFSVPELTDEDGGVSAGCDYNGTHYGVGFGFTAADGCNKCLCRPDGTADCSNAACPITFCGGAEGKTCPKGKYCDFGPTQCGSAGTCMNTPSACTTVELAAPVCGCNGKIYANACAAAAAGVVSIRQSAR